MGHQIDVDWSLTRIAQGGRATGPKTQYGASSNECSQEGGVGLTSKVPAFQTSKQLPRPFQLVLR